MGGGVRREGGCKRHRGHAERARAEGTAERSASAWPSWGLRGQSAAPSIREGHPGAAAPCPAMADIVIRNGTIVDGTGAPAYVGDVAIRDGLILDVGVNLVVKGTREIDASGKHVTPGWVDPHTHYDAHAMWDPTLNPSTGSGVTTVVCGNCAVGLAPCPKPLRTFATDLLEAIEDIPAASINSLEGFYQWETFPEYMAHMETKSFACDIGVLVGHASIRSWVMGTQANASDVPGGAESAPLTDDDIAKMRKVTEEAVAAGALGFSSSRVSSHRDATGVLLPGSLASRGELLAMGNGIADGGGGVFELASSWDLYDDFVREGRPDRELVREYERKDRDLLHAMATIPGVTVTTGGGSGQPVGGGTSMTPETAWSHTGVLEMIDAITASGGDMWTTPMMRLGNVFIGIKGEAMNPLLASKRFREFVKMDVTSLMPCCSSFRTMTPSGQRSLRSSARSKTARSACTLSDTSRSASGSGRGRLISRTRRKTACCSRQSWRTRRCGSTCTTS